MGWATCNPQRCGPLENTKIKTKARSAVKAYDWEGHQHTSVQTRTHTQRKWAFVRSTSRSISVCGTAIVLKSSWEMKIE